MKRALVFLFVSLILIVSVPLRAADAVALAAQQEAAENQKRLVASIEEMHLTFAAQQKELATLKTELSKLRDELAHKDNDAATKESLRKLHDEIMKVDAARVADGKLDQERFERMGEAIKKAINAKQGRPADLSTGGSTKPAPARGGAPTASANEEGFEYIVVSGDRPDKISAKYKAEGINVSSSAIVKANPTVDWSKLQVGQKLFIPKPK